MSNLPELRTGDVVTLEDGQRVILMRGVAYFIDQEFVTYELLGCLTNDYKIKSVDRKVNSTWMEIERTSICRLLHHILPDKQDRGYCEYEEIWRESTPKEELIASVRKDLEVLAKRLEILEGGKSGKS
jgi:hypothetical protein